jgi:hypothetical protein
MTTTIDTLAADIVKAAETNRDTRVENEDNAGRYDWSDAAMQRAYVAVIESINFEVKDARSVTASVVDTREGRIWAYAAAEFLDVASSDVDSSGFPFPETAIIGQVSPTVYSLTW